MKVEIFELERRQSLWENTVEYNLTESGFHPYKLKELLSNNQLLELQDLQLGYGQTNGSIELRETIAKLYKNTNLNNILLTNGSAEANFVAMWSLLEPDDEIVLMLPNYMQIWGIAKSFGVDVKPINLKQNLDWGMDIEELRNIVSKKTKMIALCNPNNPTGSTLTLDQMNDITEIASEVGAWIYVDEIYRGAELDGKAIPSFIGMYDKVIVTGGLSKAYGLPGLRIGWLVGPEIEIEKAWAYHDYTSISTGLISQKIANWVLQPEKRPELLNRNRSMLKENVQVMEEWIKKHQDKLSFVPPKAGGMAFIQYNFNINSTELTKRLKNEKSTLIVAGDCFGMDNYLRIGLGSEKEYLLAGLKRIEEIIEEY